MKAPFVFKVARTFLLGSILVLSATRSSADTNGIFADFTTSMGSFTCRLDYALVPRTVANFVGLATGEQAWVDLPSGVVKSEPFYDGLTFHRVVSGFMIQGGSPNGSGTDGPGYNFPDEFDPSLRHDGPGVLSMANSGEDSNGAQFFITVASTSWLDDVHSVFGRVESGQSVVDAINQVATNSSSKPLTNVYIQQIDIRRVGSEAQAFDLHAYSLPVVTNIPLSIAMGQGDVSLVFSNQLFAESLLYSTTNLTSWTYEGIPLRVDPPVTNQVERPIDSAHEFFHMAQVQYSSLAPSNVLSQTLTLAFDNSGPTIVIAFDEIGTGTYTWDLGEPGTVTSYDWYLDPFGGSLWPIQYSGIAAMFLFLDFITPTSGSFDGVAYPNYPGSSGAFSVSGTFELAP